MLDQAEKIAETTGPKITRKSKKLKVGAWIKFTPIEGDEARLAEVTDVWKNGKGVVVKVMVTSPEFEDGGNTVEVDADMVLEVR